MRAKRNKGRQEKESVSEKVSNYLELPRELITDSSKFVIFDNKEITIESFKGILEYDENCIRINTKPGIVALSGNSLEIKNITEDEIEIKGVIQKIEFFC